MNRRLQCQIIACVNIIDDATCGDSEKLEVLVEHESLTEICISTFSMLEISLRDMRPILFGNFYDSI